MAVTHLSAVVGGRTRCWVHRPPLCHGIGISCRQWGPHGAKVCINNSRSQCYLNRRWLGCRHRLLTLAEETVSVRDEFYQLINTKDSEGQELGERSCDFFFPASKIKSLSNRGKRTQQDETVLEAQGKYYKVSGCSSLWLYVFTDEFQSLRT